MKKRLFILLFVLIAAAAAYWLVLGGNDEEYTYRTEVVTRGEIEKVVRATGTINPLQTVKVGSQVSGTIAKLFVDFNSTVTSGQIVAVMNPARRRVGDGAWVMVGWQVQGNGRACPARKGGVLEVTLPKVEAARRRNVDIQ